MFNNSEKLKSINGLKNNLDCVYDERGGGAGAKLDISSLGLRACNCSLRREFKTNWVMGTMVSIETIKTTFSTLHQIRKH